MENNDITFDHKEGFKIKMIDFFLHSREFCCSITDDDNNHTETLTFIMKIKSKLSFDIYYSFRY